jgi:hypothetical protein
MAQKTTIAFSATELSRGSILDILAKANVAERDVLTEPDGLDLLVLEFVGQDDRATSLKRELSSRGIDWFETKEEPATDAEIEKAALARVRVDRAPVGQGGPRHGTEYDLTSACPKCGTGAVQTSCLSLRRSEIPTSGDVFEALTGEILVSPSVAGRLRKAGAPAGELQAACEAGTKTELDWVQLLPHTELPRLDVKASGLEVEDQCPKCRRDGYFMRPDRPFRPTFTEALDPKELPIVARSWEHFGNSRLTEPFSQSFFAQPAIFVSSGALGVMKRLKSVDLELAVVQVAGSP